MDNEKKLASCYNAVKGKIPFTPSIAIVLGSGLGALADEIDVRARISYTEITDFPVSTVPGHNGSFVFGYIDDAPVVIMQGRVHYYEGYEMSDVVLPCRLMKLMGAKVLFLTNASGGINPAYNAGDFMLISDHISSFVPNPLRGHNIEALGPRFPDMTSVYNKKLRTVITEAASSLGINLREGVYAQLCGPSFESPAEIRMLRMLGADAVGMSTVVEAIAANHAGMTVCGISCISNAAAGMTGTALSHKEVIEAADKAAPFFKKLIKKSIVDINKAL